MSCLLHFNIYNVHLLFKNVRLLCDVFFWKKNFHKSRNVSHMQNKSSCAQSELLLLNWLTHFELYLQNIRAKPLQWFWMQISATKIESTKRIAAHVRVRKTPRERNWETREREREVCERDEPESKRRWLQFVSTNITVNEQLPRTAFVSKFVRSISAARNGKQSSIQDFFPYYLGLNEQNLINEWVA